MTSPPFLDAGADGARSLRFTSVANDVWTPLQLYLRRRAHTDDVDDVAAETLAVMWRRLDDIPAGAELPWCYSIARRCLANHRRGTARRRRLVDRLSGGRQHSPPDADDPATLIDEIDPTLRRALGRLSTDDRELLMLWAWEQLSVGEIAVALGATPNTASVRLRRARRRLADQLTASGCHIEDGAGHMEHGHTQETLP